MPQLTLTGKQVVLWRRRWQQSYDALVAVECHESQAAFRRMIEEVLSDAPRIAKTIPMQPGQPVRIECEYERHGTRADTHLLIVRGGDARTPEYTMVLRFGAGG